MATGDLCQEDNSELDNLLPLVRKQSLVYVERISWRVGEASIVLENVFIFSSLRQKCSHDDKSV
jgi:hypothetical protein